MANIPGTNVSAMVVPFDTQDIYATHNDKYGRGGFRVCDTIVDRDSITTPRRKAGMWVKVIETNKIYSLDANETTWTEVTFSGGGSGSNAIATRSALGQVIVGNGLSVTSAGVISVDTSVNSISRSTVPPGSILDVDLVSKDNVIAIKWSITIVDPIVKQAHSFEVSANHADSGDIYYLVSSMFGDVLDVSVAASSVGNNIVLLVTNNTSHEVEVTTSRPVLHPKVVPSSIAPTAIKETLAGSAFINIASMNMDTTRAVKWMLTIEDTVLGTIRTYDVTAHHSYGILANGGNVNWTVSSIYGDCTSGKVDAVINGNIMNLQVTNLSANLLRLTATIVSIHPM
jgi:hypothetical protein